ncbi:MAG: hypothetical protein ABIR81_04580 [Ginsengibacter sp.]
MKQFFHVLFLQSFAFCVVHGQSFTMDDLLEIRNQGKNLDHFMAKNNFAPDNAFDRSDSVTTFTEKSRNRKKELNSPRTVEMYKKNDVKCYAFHTASLKDFLDGQKKLMKAGYFYDRNKNYTKDSLILYQRKNLAIQATLVLKDSIPRYTFLLEEKRIPDITEVKYGEDLLHFDSHEFLVSYFGEENVTKDMYFLSETELKKCSILFSGTNRQVVFVWKDETNLNGLDYILLSNVLPTAGAAKLNGVTGNNEWTLHNGLYPGMTIKELLKLNEIDFEIYGNASDLAFMIKPEAAGKIDFKKTAVMLNCNSCDTDRYFNKKFVSALALAKQNLPLYVYDLIIYPESREN